METLFATSHHLCSIRKPWPMHSAFQIVDLRFGQHNDDRHRVASNAGSIDGPAQQRRPFSNMNCLGTGAAHPLAGAACYDDGGALHEVKGR
jgi:hypothetical protein